MPTELTFPEDSQQGDLQCVDVDIIDDEAVENYEYFYVELSTDDADVQLLSYYQRRRFSINDNDGKIYLIVDIIMDQEIILLASQRVTPTGQLIHSCNINVIL